MVCPYCQSNNVKKVFSDRCQCQCCKGIFHPKESFKGNYVNYYYEDKRRDKRCHHLLDVQSAIPFD